MRATMETIKNLTEQGYRAHHVAWARGYVSRVENDGMGYLEEYTGRFGTGYKWHYASKRSTQYHGITYMIKEDN